MLHDIGRDGKKKKHNERGAEMAREYLCSVEFPADKIGAVCHAILTHNNEIYGKQKTLEAKILYDADKMDNVGTIGVARSLIEIGNYNNPMYLIDSSGVCMDENCETDTFVRYYLKTISKNYDRFFTETAKEIAMKQKEVDEQFFSSLVNLVNDNCRELNKIDDLLEN